MDQSEVYRKLALRVAPSVVVVEDKKKSSIFSGCVIHKTDSDTFVLTKDEVMDNESDLVVHFSDNSAKPAKCIKSGPWFSVLAVGEEHKTCNSVLWTDPVIDSDVLILVPKSTSSYQKIKGFTSGSCEAAAGHAPPASVCEQTRDLFITSCHHGQTEMMVSTPVFNKDGKGTGVVLADCREQGDGIPQKICLSHTGLMEVLQVITGEKNWQDALSSSDKTKQEQSDDKSKKEQSEDKPKKEQRKRKHGQTKTGRKASRHKKVS